MNFRDRHLLDSAAMLPELPEADQKDHDYGNVARVIYPTDETGRCHEDRRNPRDTDERSYPRGVGQPAYVGNGAYYPGNKGERDYPGNRSYPRDEPERGYSGKK